MTEQPILFRDRSLPDASVQQASQQWLPIEINQVSTGNFQGRLREIRHADGSVFFEDHNRSVHKLGFIEDDWCTVSFVRATEQAPELRFSEYHAHDTSMFFLPRAYEFDIHVAGGAQTVYFLFRQSELLERARALDPVRWEKDPDELLAFDSPSRSLDALATYLYSSPLFQTNRDVRHADGRWSGLIMDEVLLALNDASPSRPDAGAITRRRAKRIMRRALEYTEAEFRRHHCPGIVDICQQLNVSRRTLQNSFHEILGLAPNTYLRYLRLNRVRAELASAEHAGTTVTEIATSWNFFHLGRFSNDYLSLFGELPSTTLNKSRK